MSRAGVQHGAVLPSSTVLPGWAARSSRWKRQLDMFERIYVAFPGNCLFQGWTSWFVCVNFLFYCWPPFSHLSQQSCHTFFLLPITRPLQLNSLLSTITPKVDAHVIEIRFVCQHFTSSVCTLKPIKPLNVMGYLALGWSEMCISNTDIAGRSRSSCSTGAVCRGLHGWLI